MPADPLTEEEIAERVAKVESDFAAGTAPPSVTVDEIDARLAAYKGRAEAAEANVRMCEPCSKGDHDSCTGNCLSLCCAVEAEQEATREAEARAEQLESALREAQAIIRHARKQLPEGCGPARRIDVYFGALELGNKGDAE